MLRQAPSEPVAASKLRQACAELERCLGAGESGGAESVFEAHPALHDDADAALEVIYTEFVAREQLGQCPTAEQFYARFPQWRDGLEQLFQIHRAVGDHSTVIPGRAGTPLPDGGRLQSWLRPAEAGAPAAARARDEPARDEPARDEPARDEPARDVARRVGNHEILGEIGRGGMGVVYKARQLGLNRLVALKMILAGADAGQRERTRFRAEAEAAARLQHPNIVQIHEIGEHDGRPFLALEYVVGGSLEEKLTGEPWPATDAARLIETLARAMQHAHERGVVHRDLKPANVLLVSGGVVNQPKITDFGLARRLPVRDTAAESPTAQPAPTAQTRSGAIVGTPAYMAPEQAAADSRNIGPAADIYALGAMLYELLTARPPFQGVSVLAILEHIRTREPLPPSRLLPGLPRDLETICLQCLHKEPTRRYPSAVALADDLGRFLRGEPIHARPTPGWEKAWKWVKRRPAVAALLGTLVVLTVVGLTSVTLLWRQTAAALLTVQRERDDKDAVLAAKLVLLAHRDWLANDIEQARRHLDECAAEHRGPEWRYLHRVCHACQFVLGSPTASAAAEHRVHSLAWSADGRRLASNLSYDTVNIWEPDTGPEALTLKAATGVFHTIRFRPDGRLLSLSTAGRRYAGRTTVDVRVWDLKTYEVVREFTAGAGLVERTASGDGRRLALAGPKAVDIIDVDSGVTLATMPYDGALGWDRLALSHDGQLLAWGLVQRNVRTFKVQVFDMTGAIVGQVPTMFHSGAVVFSPDGKRLAAGESDPNTMTDVFEISDYRAGKIITAIHGHKSLQGPAAFSPDGRRLATCGVDKNVMVWDADTGKELFTFRGHLAPVRALAFSPDGTRLASGSNDGSVRIWDVRPFDGPVLESPAPANFPSSQAAAAVNNVAQATKELLITRKP
jgi:serine/threonine protein kinase